MLNTMVERELHQQLETLPLDRQRQVLDFARALAATQAQGVSGQSLLSFAGAIDATDLALMIEAIKDDCERISPTEW
jgi:hypothetical protein